ncbi:MAG: hypothetical protein JKY65_23195 [Planctomycetes bacterium]|nr:hypothetical protein [Planctomycetota bacterium]
MPKKINWKADRPSADYTDVELQDTSIFNAMRDSFPGHDDAVVLSLVRSSVDAHWELQHAGRVKEAILHVFELLNSSDGELIITTSGDHRPLRTSPSAQRSSASAQASGGGRFKLADYVPFIGQEFSETPGVKKKERKGTYTLKVEKPTEGSAKPVTLRLVQNLEKGSAPDIVFPRPNGAKDTKKTRYVDTATDVLKQSMLSLPKTPGVYFGLGSAQKDIV